MANGQAHNRISAKKRHSYSIRLHKGLLADLHRVARTNRRTVNAEIVLRLENSLVKIV